MSLRELLVNADPKTITSQGTKRFREIRVNVAQAMIIREKNGKYNFEHLLKLFPEGERKAQKETKVRIERLRVVFSDLFFIDYTARGDKPLLIRFDIDMDKTYRDIDDLEEFRQKIIGDFLDRIEIGEIRNFELGNLVDIARSALAAIPDGTKTRIFGPGKERDKVLKELGNRFMNRIEKITGT